jgi:hypothetical protein
MTLTSGNTVSDNLRTKFHLNDPDTSPGNAREVKKVNEAGPASVREPNFAELHALFKIQYEQFLTDTSDEIAIRTRRLSELKSIVYGNPPSE